MWWLCDESIKALKRLAFVQPTGRAEGSGGRLEKWGSLCEISLGNPSDARPHYGCGYSMKESPLSGLPVLISSTQAKASSSPSFIPHLCAGGPLLTQKQSHSLACIPWPGLWAGLPSCEDKCICVGVCCLCVQVCVCVHTRIQGGSIVTDGNLFASCSTSSPSLTVAKSKMVGAILSHSFSKWWHTTLKLLQWTLKRGVKHLHNVAFKSVYFFVNAY